MNAAQGASWTFVEEGRHEAGFSEVWQNMVVPRLPALEESWLRAQTHWQWRRRLGTALLVLGPATGIAVLLASGYGLILASLLIAGGLACGIMLRRRPAMEAKPLRELLIAAACAHIGDLAYQRVTARRVEFDHHAELGLVPAFASALTEDYFQGSHRDMVFRLIEAELRGPGRRHLFHGLLLEIVTDHVFTGRISIAHRRDENSQPLLGAGLLGTPPGQPVVLRNDPMFHRRFDIFADDEESARALLTAGLRQALEHLAHHLGDAAWQAGFAWGRLLVAVPDTRTFFEPVSARTLVFDPVADGHRVLEDLRLPYEIIDILHRIDPETGRRARAL